MTFKELAIGDKFILESRPARVNTKIAKNKYLLDNDNTMRISPKQIVIKVEN